MMRRVHCFAVVFIFLALSTIMPGGEKPAVHLAGLQIVGPGYGLNGTELQAFHQQSGTTLALVAEAPENKKIVDVDDDKCSLVEFADDRGHTLLDGVDWGGFPKISEDGRMALIEVSSKRQPSGGAVQIHARGTIHLRVAASMITENIENLKLNVGTKAYIRQQVIQVMKVQAENDGMTLVLQISREFMNNMKDIRFYTTNGDPVEIWSQGSFTFGNTSQMEYNCNIQTIPEALRIEIDLWQELEILKAPFKIKSGLGF
ncbi:hypothetical protein JW835_09190 [bacterium]|nr:hypothetical protein [bacterium]